MTFTQSEIDEILSFHCVSNPAFFPSSFSTSLSAMSTRNVEVQSLSKERRTICCVDRGKPFPLLHRKVFHLLSTFLFSFDTLVTPWFYYRIMIIHLLMVLFIFCVLFIAGVGCLIDETPQPPLSLCFAATTQRNKRSGPTIQCHQTAGLCQTVFSVVVSNVRQYNSKGKVSNLYFTGKNE